MNISWKNIKLWLNANYRMTEVYDCYVNSNWIKNHYNLDFPTEIEIETINRCNGTCAFCPVNVNMPQREKSRHVGRVIS